MTRHVPLQPRRPFFGGAAPARWISYQIDAFATEHSSIPGSAATVKVCLSTADPLPQIPLCAMLMGPAEKTEAVKQ
ncbi:unnamed protein product [Nippostrongylus brasiliensis]|uniref:Alpha/beta hydrolase n=1 Tax=Nippostrongylus brasiliensis TaxID=27835 RepID=A0A0N4YZB8_NIPBR|nr:unnamed protein product [Nippostrongylus brasiliensis]